MNSTNKTKFRKVIRPAVYMILILYIVLSAISFDRSFNTLSDKINSNGDEEFEFVCKISDYPIPNEDEIKIYADILSTNHPEKLKGRRLLLRLPEAEKDNARYGYTLKLTGSIFAASEAMNQGGFNYRRYLESKRVIGIFDMSKGGSIECTDRAEGYFNIIYRFRTKIISVLNEYFKGDEGGLIVAMLTGERSGISDKMNDAYKIAGIFHIVSVSGLHAGIFIAVVSFILLYIPIRRRKKSLLIRFCAVAVAILLYIFTGFGITITRVIYMMALMLCAVLIKREYNILTAVPMAAILILIPMPEQIFDQSFQLTFLSTYGLCYGLKLFENKIPDNTAGKYLLLPLVISLGATIATLHVSVYNYRMISLVSFLTNLIAVPLSSYLLCAEVVFALVALFLPKGLVTLLSFGVYAPALLINELSYLVAKFDFSYIRVMPPQFFRTSVYVIIAGAMIYFGIKKRKKSAIATFLLGVVFFGIMMYNTNTTHTEVTFVNAGKGESVIVKTPDNMITVIDCGSKSSANPSEDMFVPYFDHSEIKHIDRLFISYFDDEHTNAVTALMRDGYVKELILPPETDITKENISFNRRKIIDAAGKFGVEYSNINYNQSVHIGKDTQIFLHSGNENLSDKNSCALYRINCGDVSFLLSSCLGAKGQTLYSNKNMDCTVLKTPNYSNTVKSTESYIKAANPEYAVVTVPENDMYIKFDTKTHDILKNCNIPYARTDKNKTITFITDGKKIDAVKLRKGELH